jgi:hypothetical protein
MVTLQNQTATPESVWAMLQEIGRKQEETAKRQEETGKQIDQLQKTVGGLGNNLGKFAEEYFFSSFEKGQRNFFGENFDKIRKQIRGIELEDEYDILLINGKSVGIIEVKFKAHESDVPKVLRKTGTFRVNFPEYKNHQVYLGLATMSFYPELEEECIKEGIAIIKQVGDSVVINDKHLKVF